MKTSWMTLLKQALGSVCSRLPSGKPWCLTTFLLVLVAATPAVAFQSGDFYYDLNYPDTNTVVIAYTGTGGAVDIPATLDGKRVTALGDYAFSPNTGLTSVTMPTNLTDIGMYAFSECSNLTNVTVGVNVTRIAHSAFIKCSKLVSIVIPDSVTGIKGSTFSACTALTNVTIGAGVTNILYYAFLGCTNLTEVVIPGSVEFIEQDAFNNCKKMTGVYFKGNAPHPEPTTFANGSLATVYRMPGATGWPVVPNPWGGRPTALWGASPTKIIGVSGNLAFGTVTTGQTATATLTVSNTGNSPLTVSGITYPTGFSGAWSGTIAAGGSQGVTVTFAPVAVTAYSGTVTVNSDKTSGVNTLSASGAGAAAAPHVDYTYTTNAGTITITGYTGSGVAVSVPNKINGLTVTGIGNFAFKQCTNLTSVTLGDGITSIGDSAFHTCSSLTNLIIGSSVTMIADSAFMYCTNLTSIAIPDSVTSMGRYTFYDCTRLSNVTIGNGLTSIPNNTFEVCLSLTNVTIGTSVTSIGAGVFQSCYLLSSITIPSSVTNIGNSCFAYCNGLMGVYFNGNAPLVGTAVFNYAINATVYRRAGATGWPVVPDPWGGRPTAIWGASPTKIIGVSGNLAFGTVTTGQTATATLTVSNTGNSPLTVSGITYPTGFSGAWSGTIAAGGSQGVTVTFAPVAVTAYSGTVTVNSDKTSGMNTSSASGTGIAVASSDYFTYTTSNGNITITGYTGPGGAVSIPVALSGLPVISIGFRAFAQCASLASVTIPDSVTNIGTAAFMDCTGLVSVVIGSGVASLGDVAFDNCTNLGSVYFRGNAPQMGVYVFMNVHATIYYLAGTTGWTNPWQGLTTALWAVISNKAPVMTKRSPAVNPAAVSEGVSVTFSATADDSADTDSAKRGMSNITWYVDGIVKLETRAGAPGAITSAFVWKTDANTVQGMAYKEFAVKAVALDRTRGTAETNWTVRVNNVPAAQTIVFKPLPTVALGATNFNPGAAVSSGLPVVYSNSNPAVAQIVGGLIRVVGAGTAVITASHPGNFDFKAATPVKQTLTVKALLTAEVPSGGGTVTGAGLYLPGTKVALTAKPGTGNTFFHWEDGSQTTARSLVMPNANTAVQAWFGITTNVPKPVITDPGAQRAMVGVHFRLPLDIVSDSLPTVTVTGLPAGLAYVAAAGMIAGVPTVAASNKTVTVTAKNVNKTAATRTFAMTVEPLPAWASGAFNGAAGTGALGSGSASLSVTALGAATGKLTLRGTNFSFSAKSYAGRGGDGSFTLVTTAAVGKVAWPLTLSLYGPECTDTNGVTPPTLSKAEGALNADGWMTLYRNVWKDSGMAAVLTNNWAGYYTAVLPGGSEHGSGYLTFTVDKLGGVKTVGKLADGTAVSLSGTLILDEAGRAWTVLYSAPVAYKGGGVFGVAEFVRPGDGAKAIVRLLDGETFVWDSLSLSATQSYGAGFDRRLDLCGGWYDTVGNLYRYYGSGVLQAVTDARAAAPEILVGTNRYDSACWEPDGLVLTAVTNRSGVMTGLSALKAWTPVKVGGGNAYDYASGTNAVGLTVGLDRPTGVFKGTFKAWFDTAATHTSKLISYEGVLTPEREAAEDGVAGRGFFVWPDTSVYLSPLGKPVSYGFNWSYDFKILLSDSVRLFLTGTDNGRAVSLRAGSVLQVDLAGNPSTGFSWQVDAYDPAVLTKVSEAYEQDRGNPFATGVGGVYTFRFYAESAGVSPLRLVYRGPPGAPADTFDVQATIR